MYGWRARIGIIYPSSGLRDTDFVRLAPQGVSVHVTRISFKSLGTVKAIKEMSELENLLQAARLLAHVEPSCITWADTSGSFLFGSGGDVQQIKAIEKETGIPASTTSTACVKAFEALGVSNICVASPYLEEVNEMMRAFLCARGFKVVQLESLELRESSRIARVDPETIYHMSKKATSSGGEALFVPCTDFLDLDLIQDLERALSIPVVAANQATMWHALRLSGIRDQLQGFGRLMLVN